MGHRAGLLVLAAACLVFPASAAAQPYAVYVASSEQQATPAEQKAREDSADDVRKALQDRKYHDLFVLVPSPETADVLIEVAWRGPFETSAQVTSSRRVPGATTPPLGSEQRVVQNNLRLRIVVRTSEHELWAVDPGRPGRFGGIPHLGWRELAGRAADRAATWVRQNRKLLERA